MDKPLGNLANYLAQYWQRSLSVRSKNIFDGQFDSNKVKELFVYANWFTGSWDINYKANHTLGLHQIISRGNDEIKAIADKARTSSEDEDISYLLDIAQQVKSEIDAARELQELLDG